MKRSFYVRLSFTLLYVLFGYMIDQSGERSSLNFMRLPVVEEHFLPLYPFYLVCRTQCFIFYRLYRIIPYLTGGWLLYILWRCLLIFVFQTVPKAMARSVFHEYLRSPKQQCELKCE